MKKRDIGQSSIGTELPCAIFAAGGIVLGRCDTQSKIAVVRRSRYGPELSLPKGKLREAESETEAAVREVHEETGCRVKIREYGGSTHYTVHGTPKIVFYFIMDLEEDNRAGPTSGKEVDAVEWISPQMAKRTLTHAEDRALLKAVFLEDSVTMTAIHIIAKSALAWLFGSLEKDRLVGEISRTWIEFDELIQRQAQNGLTEPWARGAIRYLLEAENCVGQ